MKDDFRSTGAFRITQRFNESADRVFDAWVDPDIARRWLFATASRPVARARIDARAGRSCSLEDSDAVWTGRYLEVARPRRLVFAYAARGRASQARINVDIVPLAKGCKLTLTHEGAPPEPAAGCDGRWA